MTIMGGRCNSIVPEIVFLTFRTATKCNLPWTGPRHIRCAIVVPRTNDQHVFGAGSTERVARDQANSEPSDAEMVKALDEAMGSMADNTLNALETPELQPAREALEQAQQRALQIAAKTMYSASRRTRVY